GRRPRGRLRPRRARRRDDGRSVDPRGPRRAAAADLGAALSGWRAGRDRCDARCARGRGCADPAAGAIGTMKHRIAESESSLFGGRYTLLRRLEVGGMAEIYLARQAAMAGFEKLVVIKRLRAELAQDARVVEMFLEEARIGAALNHPNIV